MSAQELREAPLADMAKQKEQARALMLAIGEDAARAYGEQNPNVKGWIDQFFDKPKEQEALGDTGENQVSAGKTAEDESGGSGVGLSLPEAGEQREAPSAPLQSGSTGKGSIIR